MLVSTQQGLSTQIALFKRTRQSAWQCSLRCAMNVMFSKIRGWRRKFKTALHTVYSIDWFWLWGWLINEAAICTGTAPLFWNFISLLERPRTRLVRKIGSQNQSINSIKSSITELAFWENVCFTGHDSSCHVQACVRVFPLSIFFSEVFF